MFMRSNREEKGTTIKGKEKRRIHRHDSRKLGRRALEANVRVFKTM